VIRHEGAAISLLPWGDPAAGEPPAPD